MSIVGTRPPLISETNLYEPRHKVRKVTRFDSYYSVNRKVYSQQEIC